MSASTTCSPRRGEQDACVEVRVRSGTIESIGAGHSSLCLGPAKPGHDTGLCGADGRSSYLPPAPQLDFPHFTRSGNQSLRIVLPVRHGLRRCRSVAGRSENPPLSMRGLAARDNGRALIVGHVDARASADRCWRKLVTHAVLTVRCAHARKVIAEKMRRTAESRGGHVPPRLRRRHAASAALSGPPHLLRDELRRIAGQPVPPR